MIIRYLVTVSQIVEIDDADCSVDISDETLEQSLNDDLLDGQDSLHETSDSKIHYTPKELVELKITKLSSIE